MKLTVIIVIMIFFVFRSFVSRCVFVRILFKFYENLQLLFFRINTIYYIRVLDSPSF